MPSDPYYKSQHRRRLRAAALRCDRNTCVVPGCGQRAVGGKARPRTKLEE